MKDRKIIQICVKPAVSKKAHSVLYALCDDGTVWAMWGNKPFDWERVSTERLELASYVEDAAIHFV